MSIPELFSLSSCVFESYIHEIEQWFVPAIVSERTLSRIREVLHALPGQMTNAIGLEFHASVADYDCDISLSIDPFVDRNELVPWRPEAFSNNGKNHALIRDIGIIPEIVKAWDDPHTRLSEVVREIILEIDTRASAPSIPLNIFLTMQESSDPGKIGEIISGGLADTIDGSIRSELPDCLDRIAALPKDLLITHLGFMVGRPSKAVRVLARCNTADLHDALTTLGLDSERYLCFEDFYKIIKPRCRYVAIAANLFQNGIGTDFAIECGSLETDETDTDAWWPDFIGAIGTLGNWDAQIASMLLVESVKKRRNAQLQTQDNSDSHVKWGLNHIKIGFSKKERPTMKWYVALHGVAVTHS